MTDLILQFYDNFISFPCTDARYNELATGMMEYTKLKGAIGCIDGSHIPIEKPDNFDSRSIYNFKGWYSHLIVVICDYKLRIIAVSTGHTGRTADSTTVH